MTTAVSPAEPHARRVEPARARVATAMLVAVPLAWGLVLLLHPTGDGDEFYPIVREQVTPWLAVHVATLVFIPLMALTLHQLLRGIDGTAAKVSRVAIPIFAVAYTAWEAVIGIGTGILVDQVNALPDTERATGARLVEQFTGDSVLRALEYTGSAAWIIAVVAAAVAFRHALELNLGLLCLFVLSAPLITAHVPPFGPVGLVIFIATVLAVVRTQQPTQPGIYSAISGAAP